MTTLRRPAATAFSRRRAGTTSPNATIAAATSSSWTAILRSSDGNTFSTRIRRMPISARRNSIPMSFGTRIATSSRRSEQLNRTAHQLLPLNKNQNRNPNDDHENKTHDNRQSADPVPGGFKRPGGNYPQ